MSTVGASLMRCGMMAAFGMYWTGMDTIASLTASADVDGGSVVGFGVANN